MAARAELKVQNLGDSYEIKKKYDPSNGITSWAACKRVETAQPQEKEKVRESMYTNQISDSKLSQVGSAALVPSQMEQLESQFKKIHGGCKGNQLDKIIKDTMKLSQNGPRKETSTQSSIPYLNAEIKIVTRNRVSDDLLQASAVTSRPAVSPARKSRSNLSKQQSPELKAMKQQTFDAPIYKAPHVFMFDGVRKRKVILQHGKPYYGRDLQF